LSLVAQASAASRLSLLGAKPQATRRPPSLRFGAASPLLGCRAEKDQAPIAAAAIGRDPAGLKVTEGLRSAPPACAAMRRGRQAHLRPVGGREIQGPTRSCASLLNMSSAVARTASRIPFGGRSSALLRVATARPSLTPPRPQR
jgi:hypothetical protein